MTSSKQNKVIEKIKSNLCIFVCKDQNYDNVQQQKEEQIKVNDNLDKLFTPKFETKSRSRMPIYYKTPTLQNDTLDHDYDEVASESKIYDYIQSPNISKFPFLFMSPETSTKSKHESYSKLNDEKFDNLKNYKLESSYDEDYIMVNLSKRKAQGFAKLDDGIHIMANLV
jgi:hypothetical protein